MTTVNLPIPHDVAARAERRVFKYPLEITYYQTVAMPHGAEILCVQVQGCQPCLWALVNPNNPLSDRQFRITGTGHPADDVSADRYIGTVQMMGGGLNWHVFEVAP